MHTYICIYIISFDWEAWIKLPVKILPIESQAKAELSSKIFNLIIKNLQITHTD